KLRQGSIVWSGRYKNGGVLLAARTGRDGQRLQQKVQNPRVRQETIVQSRQHKNGGVLSTAREGCNSVPKDLGKEVGPHNAGKETIGDVIPVAPNIQPFISSTKSSQPSGVSRDSRKRVRHSEITSTASKRAVAQESTAGAVTVPDIDGQKSPVKRVLLL
ncbi:unnamed protein product, partial [Ascophyllum nodosum]